MSFLKKHFVWIALAVILLAEGGATFVLLGKKAEAKRMLEDLAGKKKRREELKAMRLDDSKRIEKAEARKADLIDQCARSALFFWYRDQKIEASFDPKKHPDLAKLSIRPWDERTRSLPRLRLAFGNAYNREAEELSETAERLRIDRRGIGLASDTAFPQPHVTVGDICMALKEFWIRKEVVDLAVKAGVAELDPITLDRVSVAAATGRRRATRSRSAETKPGSKLLKPVAVSLVVRCQYAKLGVFVAELLRSPLSFRIKSIVETVRARPAGAAGLGGRRGSARRPGAPPMMEPMMEGPPRGVRAPAMPPDMMGEEGMVPPGRPGRAMRGEVGPGRRGTRAAPAAVLDSADQQLVEAQIVCEVSDFGLDLARARFSGAKLGKKAAVRTWLERRIRATTSRKPTRRGLPPGVAGALSDAERLLWRKALDALGTDAAKEAGKSVEITFRPKDHFGKSDGYTYATGPRDANVEVELKLVSFEPRESDQGVAKAESAPR